MGSGDIGATVVSNEISDFDRAGSQFQFVSLIKALKGESGQIGRRQEELKRSARGPSLVKSMAGLGSSHLVDR
jgi:hypothetical protein